MKTKMFIIFAVLSLFALSSCGSYNEDDVEILIRARVPNCVNVIKIETTSSCDYYAAVDSAYVMHTFSFEYGQVKNLNPKK